MIVVTEEKQGTAALFETPFIYYLLHVLISLKISCLAKVSLQLSKRNGFVKLGIYLLW